MTITQSPTFPNGTQADLIYVVSSSLAGAPQHNYLCRIKSNGGEILSTLQQPPNPSGYGVFEVSRLLDDHMGYDMPFLVSGSVPIISSSNNNINNFEIAFSEQYGTSPSSSLTIEPYISSSTVDTTNLIPAVVDRNTGNFNWTNDYDGLTNCPNIATQLNSVSAKNALIVSSSDYLTISTLNGIAFKGTVESYALQFHSGDYDAAGSAFTITNSIGPSGVDQRLLHLGVGPKNLSEVNATIASRMLNTAQYPYYSIQITYAGGTSDKHWFHNTCMQYEGTNFAFINKLGVMDYYRATLVNTERESFNRKTYRAPYIDYSTTNSTIEYDYAKRGETQYYASFQNNFTAETDWLTQEQADWLFELFESPSVYVQQGDQFVGAIITNAGEAYKTNPRGQKVFKFTIQYKLSNSKHSRY